jgi:SAM-dependent methyltransferase
MASEAERAAVRELATEFLSRGDATGWFDALYRRAGGDANVVPWADLRPNGHLQEWIERVNLPAGRALVVGCGLGDDAEFLASRGWDVTAFDISAEAIGWARRRFPHSRVSYLAADLFAAPPQWTRAFDLVVEAYTLQALPGEIRRGAFAIISEWVAPRGRVFVVARGREETDPPGQLPWPLTRAEVMEFERAGLKCETFEDYMEPGDPPVRRFRAVFSRS